MTAIQAGRPFRVDDSKLELYLEKHGIPRVAGRLFTGLGPQIPEAGPKQSPTCPGGYVGDNCLATESADFDGDGQADQAGLAYNPESGLYGLSIYLKSGRAFGPFGGTFTPGRDTLSLTLRNGEGDKRCRSWVKGSECGYLITNHNVPPNVLYLSDSKHGDFIIYMPQAYGTSYNKDGHFVVMPAFEYRPVKPRSK